MKITILAIGSRGDVQPLAALGIGLKRAGYDVRLAAFSNFRGWVEGYGLNFFPLRGTVAELLESRPFQALMKSGSLLRLLKFFASRQYVELLSYGLEDSWWASQDTDAVLYDSRIGFWGYDIASKLKVPGLQVVISPITPTSAFPLPIPSFTGLSPRMNRMTHVITEQFFWQMLRGPVNEFRKHTLGFPPAPFTGINRLQRKRRVPVIYGFSPHVVPKPHDWTDHIFLTGYWFLPSLASWVPPPSLIEFLKTGPRPISIGFGSMTEVDRGYVGDTVLNALEITGQRAVLVGKWPGLNEKMRSDSTFLIEQAPHDWLFPRMTAVIHHGGAGTTAAGLRAGVPSVIIPHFADQFFWGQRVFELGIGPEPIPRYQLTVENLANAMTIALSNSDLRHRAADMGLRIQSEHGVSQAVDLVQYLLRELG